MGLLRDVKDYLHSVHQDGRELISQEVDVIIKINGVQVRRELLLAHSVTHFGTGGKHVYAQSGASLELDIPLDLYGSSHAVKDAAMFCNGLEIPLRKYGLTDTEVQASTPPPPPKRGRVPSSYTPPKTT